MSIANKEGRMSGEDLQKRTDNPLLPLLVIVLVGVVVYAGTLHFPFFFDDETTITDNPLLRDLTNFFANSNGYRSNPGRFIGNLSFALNYRLGALDTTGYHLVNLAIHLLNALSVYALVLLFFRTPYLKESSMAPTARRLALAAGLLFVAHPVQTQAVTYISQRYTSIATLFCLLALLLYGEARLVQEASGKRFFGKAVSLHFLSVVAVVLAMKSKEIAFTLPFVVALFEFFFLGRRIGEKLLLLVPHALTILIIPLGLLSAGKAGDPMLATLNKKTMVSEVIPRWDYLLTQFRVVTTYLRLLFLPVNQNLDYDYPIYNSLLMPPVFFSFLLLAALLLLAVWLACRSHGTHSPARLVSFGICWFFITLAPESSLITINDVINEHRLYLPSVGAFIAMTTAVAVVLKRYRVRGVLPSLVVLLLVLSASTMKRNLVWQDALTLWSDVVKKSPRKERPHNNLGNALLLAGRTDEAIEEYLAAIRLKPDFAEAYNNLGVAYDRKGETGEAIKLYRAAIEKGVDRWDVHYNLGIVYGKEGRTAEAIEECKKALELKPDSAEIYNILGSLYGRQGLVDEAITNFQLALQLNPDYAEVYNNLGIAYGMKGMNAKAVECFERAVRLLPGDNEFRANLANALKK